jgi:hypothetical protein
VSFTELYFLPLKHNFCPKKRRVRLLRSRCMEIDVSLNSDLKNTRTTSIYIQQERSQNRILKSKNDFLSKFCYLLKSAFSLIYKTFINQTTYVFHISGHSGSSYVELSTIEQKLQYQSSSGIHFKPIIQTNKK